MPELLVQLTDLHVRADADRDIAAERVDRAIELVRRLDPRPAAILLTGDLVNSGAPEEYTLLVELLAPLLALGIPVLPLVGNHDDRALLRECLSGAPNVAHLGRERHLQYEWRAGSFRVLCLDTQHTGHDDGKYCDTRHAWLAARLAEDPETPTILAMHHPTFQLGLPAMDELAVRADHAARFEALVAASPAVERIVCGHVHRAATARVAHAPAFACPSVFLPLRPDLQPGARITLVDGPVGIGLHVRTPDGRLASHVRVIGPVPHAAPVD
ncbi:MAG: metallophosphatase [Thermoleophilia bacterium]|nr:metallophosphatase [Thermoleophilia bacterium]